MSREMHPQRWGDPALAQPVSESTRGLLDAFIGTRNTPASEQVSVPAPGLTDELLALLRAAVGGNAVVTDDQTRRLRARGKSTPDLLRARDDELADAPDAVVQPASHAEVSAVLAWAVDHHVAVVPFGGGTSVTGGLAARRDGFAGMISLDLVRMNRLVSVDPTSMIATLQPGMRGPDVEAALAEHSLTLGHFPQSFEFASIGGFAATRSSGQSSAGFGRFDQMVVGLRAATPLGELSLGSAPASAAGPDLRQMMLGSEGTLGVITEVTVRVRPIAEEKTYDTWSFPSFTEAAETMRQLAQRGPLPTVLRVSDEAETMVNLASQNDIGGASNSGCLMIVGHEGPPAVARRDQVAGLLAELGGTDLGTERGHAWAEGRFSAPYQRDSLLDVGILVETLETATFWSNWEQLYTDVKSALETSLGDTCLVMCHISHVYETGCSLYFTVAANGGDDPVDQWLSAKAAASEAIMAAGATITHHHAVGTDHKRWLAQEIGDVGVALLRGMKTAADPTGVMNPGVLMP